MSLLSTLVLTLLLVVNRSDARPMSVDHAVHSNHSSRSALPNSWFYPPDHKINKLFRRDTDPGTEYPAVGSDQWRSAYPSGAPDPNNLPQPWVDAFNAAVAAGKIPDIPQATLDGNGNPSYGGADPDSQQICYAGNRVCRLPGDIYDSPDGVFAVNFDDGPLPPSQTLYQFLQQNNQRATHFYIGTNILNNPDLFTMAFNMGDDLAVHTWTHPHMTTLSNLQIVGELGYTMQIIHDSSGGRVPRYWRPPYGESDARVHAIATEIFGLTAVFWNQDTSDWSLTTGGTTLDQIHQNMVQWLQGPKSPGLIVLEHELSDQSVQAFMDNYPLIKQNGWNPISACRIEGLAPYQNADDDTSPVTRMGIAGN